MGERADEWYRNWFDDDYLELYRHRDSAEAREFLDHVRARFDTFGRDGAADLACGAGRHAWVMAAAFGWPVVGVDLSMTLLEHAARTDPAELALNRARTPRFVCGDLRNLPLRSSAFRFAVNLFTSYGYFRAERDNERALREMARVLAPRGVLILDTMNARRAVETLIPEDRRQTGEWDVHQRRAYHSAARRIEKTITLRRADRPERRVTESVRIYTPAELDALLARADLETIDRWGDYHASPFSERNSPRMITIAERVR